MGVSFVTTFKSFDIEPSGGQQTSAAYSWHLTRTPQVVVVGDDLGSEQVCKTYGFTFVPHVRRGMDIGIPCRASVLPSLLEEGLKAAKHEWVCLINSDLIVSPKFSERLAKILNHFGKSSFVTGVRLDYAWSGVILDEPAYRVLWREKRRSAVYHHGGGTDYFSAHRDWWISLLKRMDPWLIGQWAWDNWLQKAAVEGAKPCVDATGVIDAMHPNHDYQHLQRTAGIRPSAGIRRSPGYIYNRKILVKTGKTSVGNPAFLRLRNLNWKGIVQ